MSVFVSALNFNSTISFQFQTTNKGISKTQQRLLFRQELKPEDVHIRVCCRVNCTRPHKALGMCHKHYKTIAVKVRFFVIIQIHTNKFLCSLI